MPPEFEENGRLWAEVNPGWKVREWRDEDLGWLQNRALYDAAPNHVPPRLVPRMRSNLARYEILRRYGGVYADSDFRPLQPIAPLLEGVEFAAVEERPGLVANGLMASRRRHPLLTQLVQGAGRSVLENPGQPSWKTTGPAYLTRVIAKHGGCTLLPTPAFYPFHHRAMHNGRAPETDLSGVVALHGWASRRRSVSVIVPWKTRCGWRRRAWEWASELYRERFPEWQVVPVSDGLRGKWSKTRAAIDGARTAFGDVLVIADGDVWTEGIGAAVEAVREGAPWAVPHELVYRFTPEATRSILKGAEPDISMPTNEPPYVGEAAGGSVVMTRAVFEECPPDPRFLGWGGEDSAWAVALTTLFGAPWRGNAPLWHLYHPPQRRITRTVGSHENRGLYLTYKAALNDRRRIRALLDEAQAVLA